MYMKKIFMYAWIKIISIFDNSLLDIFLLHLKIMHSRDSKEIQYIIRWSWKNFANDTIYRHLHVTTHIDIYRHISESHIQYFLNVRISWHSIPNTPELIK